MPALPTNPALEAAIIVHPGEDTPRLAYADWLDENGDPDRAAFIRVQCRLADMPPSDPDWVGLIEDQDDLVARLKHKFLTSVGKDADEFYFGTDLIDEHEEPFRRGFPYFIDCQTTGEAWDKAEVKRVTKELTKLVRTTTIRGFQSYSTPPERLTELLAAPVIAEFTGLALGPEAVEDEDTEFTAYYRELVKNPNLRRVKQLYLYHGTPPAAVAELARATTFDAVRRLTIQNLQAQKSALEKLTNAPWFRRLWHFRSHLESPNVAIPMITGLGKLPELHTLDLPNFAPGAVKALAKGKFPALARLRYNGPLALKYAKVIASAQFPSLVVFEASGGGAKNDGFLSLLEARWFKQLRVLDMPECDLGDKALKALAAHPVSQTLRVLKLGDNPFGKGGLAALATPGAFRELTTLSLSSYHTRKGTPADLVAFFSTLQMPNLRHLDLMGWPVGNEGAKALAENSTLANLTRLNLDACKIGDPGAKAIFASPHLQNLVELHMEDNTIKTAADAIKDRKVMPRLGECWIGGNKIPSKAAKKLKRKDLYLIT